MVFTHHERKLLKYGTVSERLGADSVKSFECCSLCLKTFVEPMCCSKGHVFCKECIYGCLLRQKQDIGEQMLKYDEQVQRLETENPRIENERRIKEIEDFDKSAHGLNLDGPQAFKTKAEPKLDLKKFDAEKKIAKKLELKSFWVPGVGDPTLTPTLLKKPSTETTCPEGNHPLRLKKLVKMKCAVNKNPQDEKLSGKGVTGTYQCPVCCKTLAGAMKAAVLKTCGHVICIHCLDQLKKEEQCAVCSVKFKEKSVIKLQSGGTGYSGSLGEKLTATVTTPTAWL